MKHLLKLVLVLLVLGFIGLVGFAYFGDMRPVQTEITAPVALDG